MSAIEEVKNFQSQGMSEEQIIQALRQKGIRYKDIVDALSQSKIQSAVVSGEEAPSPTQGQDGYSSSQSPDMEPSIMNSMSNQQEAAVPVPGASYMGQPYVNQGPEGYPAQQGQEYAQYPEQYAQQSYPQMQSSSPDMMSEIAEQVVSSKFTEIRKHLEKLADMKTTLDSKVDYLDERLKRMEKIIDALQASVLRKVGDYVTNVQDIKAEMIETQKTFAKLVPQIQAHSEHKHHEHPEHHQTHHSEHNTHHPQHNSEHHKHKK